MGEGLLVHRHHDDRTRRKTQAGSRRMRESAVMRHRGLWRVVGVGTLVVTAYALWRVVDTARALDDGEELSPLPAPATAASAPLPHLVPPGPAPWLDPDSGACPATHPVKAKLRSGIFHVPGGASYERTVPDRCYVDPAAATADGLRRARR
jgi:hypothetical protein